MLKKFKVELPIWAIPRWWVVAYKIPPPMAESYIELSKVRPDAKFEEIVSHYVAGVLEEGKMPPEEIAPAILNLANDLMSGREMVLRTGDYIMLQRHLRQG